MQQNYFTPIKNINPQHKKQFNSEVTPREGDWVCLNCQNLNYSFRKKCNRCKTQTRQDNQTQSVYSYYYFPKIEQPFESINLDRNHIQLRKGSSSSFSSNYQVRSFAEDNKENSIQLSNRCLETPKKKKYTEQQQNLKLDGLPSVSPLVKKYREKEHHTTLSKMKNAKIMDSDSKNSFDNIRVRDFDKLIQQINYPHKSIESSPFKENQSDEDTQGFKFMQEIQDSISRIII